MNEEYFSGGYYLARRAKRESYMSPELIPPEVLSGSVCICDFFPDDWAIEWVSLSDEERLKAAASFGIAPDHLGEIVAWATEGLSKTFGWPSAFYTLQAAKEARVALLPRDASVVAFGLGLHANHVEDFLEAARPPATKEGFAPVADTGIYQCVSARESIAEGGRFAGFELLSTLTGLLTCSWLCNGLERECAAQLGIRTNEHGFVATHLEALRCAEFISSDEVGAEPGLWLPWRVTIYAEP
jgi:hypothetical protein